MQFNFCVQLARCVCVTVSFVSTLSLRQELVIVCLALHYICRPSVTQYSDDRLNYCHLILIVVTFFHDKSIENRICVC